MLADQNDMESWVELNERVRTFESNGRCFDIASWEIEPMEMGSYSRIMVSLIPYWKSSIWHPEKSKYYCAICDTTNMGCRSFCSGCGAVLHSRLKKIQNHKEERC